MKRKASAARPGALRAHVTRRQTLRDTRISPNDTVFRKFWNSRLSFATLMLRKSAALAWFDGGHDDIHSPPPCRARLRCTGLDEKTSRTTPPGGYHLSPHTRRTPEAGPPASRRRSLKPALGIYPGLAARRTRSARRHDMCRRAFRLRLLVQENAPNHMLQVGRRTPCVRRAIPFTWRFQPIE